MSSLSERLEYISLPPSKKPTNFILWFTALSDDEQNTVWKALTNENLKNYTLFGIFHDEGMKVSKDNFVALRRSILAGEFVRNDIHE